MINQSGPAQYVRIIYPEPMVVKAEKVIGWAKDAIFNYELDESEFDGSLESAIELLNDIGYITTAARWWE